MIGQLGKNNRMVKQIAWRKPDGTKNEGNQGNQMVRIMEGEEQGGRSKRQKDKELAK